MIRAKPGTQDAHVPAVVTVGVSQMAVDSQPRAVPVVA